MLLVLAHAGDLGARQLVAEWGAAAHLVTPRDLSRRGWSHFPVGGGTDTLAIGDAVVPASAITGVLTRIVAVAAGDLPHIVEDDREYVAAEMTSFLLSFLTALPCPVINRPTAASLMGPGWSTARWRAAAATAGLAPPPAVPALAASETVVVIGDACFGAAAARTADAARTLARVAGVELLCAQLGGADRPYLVDLTPWAALGPAAAATLRARLAGASGMS